ncbi:MAG: hypothetical protein ACREXO_13765, partial [Advenella sp.]
RVALISALLCWRAILRAVFRKMELMLRAIMWYPHGKVASTGIYLARAAQVAVLASNTKMSV